MRPERDYLGLPIRSLQTMLRTLSRCAPGLPCPIPDGVFGEVTLEAVMRFQQSAGMPITGRVDNDTWDAIAAAYRRALPSVMPPRPVRAFREQAFEVRAGQCCVHMCLVQAMFLALSQVIEEIEPAPVNALHTGASVRNVIWLQGRAGLPETGTMEKQTWNALTRLYDVFLYRDIHGALCPTAPQTPSGGSVIPRGGFPWEPFEPGGSCL